MRTCGECNHTDNEKTRKAAIPQDWIWCDVRLRWQRPQYEACADHFEPRKEAESE